MAESRHRKDARLRPNRATSPSQWDQPLLQIKRAGWFAWKRTAGYDDLAHTVNAFARCKRTFGCRWQAKRDEVQE